MVAVARGPSYLRPIDRGAAAMTAIFPPGSPLFCGAPEKPDLAAARMRLDARLVEGERDTPLPQAAQARAP